MKYNVTRGKGEVKIEFTVPETEWEGEVEAAYRQNAKKFNIQGFRKGQAPRKVIERVYGGAVFFDDAFEDCARKSYITAIEANEDIYPVDAPKLDLVQFPEGEKPMIFTMTVTIKPEVVLGAYTGIKIEKVAYNVEQKDIEAELDRARERGVRIITVTDRAVQDGDTVILDYSGTVDGVQFSGGTAEKQTLIIGSKSFIPGFEEQVIGLKIDEEKDLQVKFPDDYHAEELKGKAAVFKVKVHGITARELPELNDEFVRDTTKFDKLTEYKEDIRKRLLEDGERRAENETRTRLMESVVEKATAEIPACMIDSELEYMLEDFSHRLQYMYQGMKLEDYFKYTGSTVEDFKKERRGEAEKAVKTRLVMQEILKKEQLEATPTEMDVSIKQMAEEAGKEFDVFKNTLSKERIAQFRNDITIDKMFDFLKKNNILEEKPETKKSGEKAAQKKTAEKADVIPAKKTKKD